MAPYGVSVVMWYVHWPVSGRVSYDDRHRCLLVITGPVVRSVFFALLFRPVCIICYGDVVIAVPQLFPNDRRSET